MSRPAAVALVQQAAAAAPVIVAASLPGTPSSAPLARQLARAALPGCPRTDDLLLAVTELAANAIAHSASGQGGTFMLTVAAGPAWARIEVTDGGPSRQPGPSNGWGLALVDGVTDRSGALTGPDGCRTAWCEAAWLQRGQTERPVAGLRGN